MPDRPAPVRPIGRRLRVCVLSPYDVVRHGVQALVSDVASLELRAATDDGTPDVDVALYDLHPWLRSNAGPRLPLPSARVVALVPDIDVRAAVAADSIGAVALLPLAAHRDDVVAAIRTAGDLSAPVASSLAVPSAWAAAHPGNPAGLSDRQLEMIGLVAAGLSNAEIAERLYVSINTVKTHLRIAYGRIGISSRARAVSWYLGEGIDARLPRVG